MQPPEGVTPAQWQAARERAAADHIAKTKPRPVEAAQVKQAYAAGWCDASGRVADYVRGE